MKISVVIATYNRSEDLKNVLESLNTQTLKDGLEYEVIIIDNNSTDQTKDIVRSFEKAFDGRLKYLFEKRQGKSFALNTGIRSATGDIIAVTDDDVVVDKEWVYHIQRVFSENKTDAMGGRVLPLYPDNTPAWIMNNRHYLRGPVVSYDFGEDTKIYDPKSMDPFIGANMAFRKSMFDECGLFRTDLGPGAGTYGDDRELVNRLWQANKKLCYCGQALVWHKTERERMTLKYFAKWNLEHGKYAALEESSGFKEEPVLIFGIPRYLYGKMIKSIFRLPLGLFNKELFCRYWCGLFFEIGMMSGYRKEAECKNR